MVDPYTPRKTVMSYGKEAVAYGTQAASLNKYPGGVNPLDRNFSNQLIKQDVIRDAIETYGFVRGYKDIKFPIQVTKWLRADLLYYVFGQQSETGPVTLVYTHTLTPYNNPYHPSLSLEVAEKQSTNSVVILTGGYLDGMEMKWDKGKPIELSLPAIFQDVSDASTSIVGTGTESSEVQYMAKHLSLTVDGTALVTNSGTLVLKKNAVAEPKADSGTGDKISQPEVGEFEWEITLVYNKRNNVGFAAWKDAAVHNVVISIVRTASSDQMVFTINNMYVDAIKNPIDLGNNVNIETLTLRGGACTLVVKDDHAW